MLRIEDLHVDVDGKEILRGLDLWVPPGEVHAVMGPNGAGKSTLAYTLAGREGYVVTRGRILYQGRDLTAMEPEERAREGLFLAFQYPVEIPGVINANLLKSAVNAVRRHRGKPELDAVDFLKLARQKLKGLNMDEAFLSRAVNVGFSGGEKKRGEIFQMWLLDPRLAVLDETDSGLDIDALKIVGDGINAWRGAARATLLITHYQRLLDYVMPDKVHVLATGRIIKSGGRELALELEAKGYADLVKAAACMTVHLEHPR